MAQVDVFVTNSGKDEPPRRQISADSPPIGHRVSAKPPPNDCRATWVIVARARVIRLQWQHWLVVHGVEIHGETAS